MRIYAIGDLHLPGAQSKPMDVFGAHWEGHFEKITADWLDRVTDEDVVMLPGDISWAMTLEEAAPDILRICALPGKKLFLRGNHDYWWSSLTRVRGLLPKGNYAVQNDAFAIGDAVFCGTRGWTVMSEASTDAQNVKIYRREAQRLELSLKDAQKKADGRPIVCMLHYPPFGEKKESSAFSDLLEAYGVHTCVYGHLHGMGVQTGFNGVRENVNYHLVSCDGLGFKLHEIEL